MDILFLSRWFPFPADNGSRIRILNMLNTLSSQHVVDLISFAGNDPCLADLGPLRDICRQVTLVPYHGFRPGSKEAVRGHLSALPSSVVATHSLAMLESVKEAWRSGLHDLVIASQLDMAPYARRLAGSPKVLEEVELTTFWEQVNGARDLLAMARRRLMWWKMSRYVAGLAGDFDALTVASDQERDLLLDVAPVPEKIRVVPNGVEMDRFTTLIGEPVADKLVYSGSLTYSANLEAVEFFAEHILPVVRRFRPQATLYVTGSYDGVPLERLRKAEGVVLTGYLDDIRPVVGTSWLSVVPLLTGGGTRLKVLEALALGTPVVSTSKGVEGLKLKAGRDYVLADTPAEFAHVVVDILGNQEERTRLSYNGRQAVNERYAWSNTSKGLLELLDELSPRSNGAHQ